MTSRHTAPDTAVAAALAALGPAGGVCGPSLNTAVSLADVETIGAAPTDLLTAHLAVEASVA